MTASLPIQHSAGLAIYANIGGPMSRTRKELISSTLLGKDDGYVRCPRVIRLGLSFRLNADPVDVVRSIMAEEGYSGPEELRARFNVPQIRLVCAPLRNAADQIDVETAEPDRVLEQALLLGLCTSQLFDATRPVLWTETSLTRRVELFDPRGFYS